MDKEIEQRIATLEAFMQSLQDNATISLEVGNAISARVLAVNGEFPEELRNAPLAAILNPSGGATIDSQARTAVTSILTALRALGLIAT